LGDAEILRLYGEIEAEEEAGPYRPYKEILRAVVRGFGTRMGFSPSDSEQQSLPDSLPNWKPFPDTVAALHRLKQKFKLGIISNIDDDLFAATAPQLEVPFDYVITAAQARAYKPFLEIFNLAERKIGQPRSEWLHAAQSVYHDVVPAKSLGIASAWVDRPSRNAGVGAVRAASEKPDVRVSSLKELAELASAIG
jgi:2-haloacid dehalogenase